MNLKTQISKGYFPKELPPPFSTNAFATKSAYINRKWEAILAQERLQKIGENAADARKRFNDEFERYESSKNLGYSISKGLLVRRKLSIPNPKQFYDLAKIVVTNWEKLKGLFNTSKYSASAPTEKEATRSIRTKSKSLNEFRFDLIDKSFNKRFELRMDISKFYQSVYTHSIPWAILGKDEAKRYFKLKRRRANWSSILATDPSAALYEFSDKLDTLVRNCQERQSVGLPIGPDISFILAELIANRMDIEIGKKLNNVNYECCRFYDDYYFYINSYNDLEQISKSVHKVFGEFNLEVNESKTKIKELPFNFQSPWETTLILHRFKSVSKFEIRNFFSLVFQLIEQYPMDSSWIISYALGMFQFGNVQIDKVNWNIFLLLLLKTQLIDPTNLDQFFKILLSYHCYIDNISKEKISTTLHEIAKKHIMLNHSFEVSWSLWILRSLKIKCAASLIADIYNSDDTISKLICLDLVNEKLVNGRGISKKELSRTLSEEDFFSDKWLFIYESLKKGWLTPKHDLIARNRYFKILSDYDVEFYIQKNQVTADFVIQDPKRPLGKVAGIIDRIKQQGKAQSKYSVKDFKEKGIEMPAKY